MSLFTTSLIFQEQKNIFMPVSPFYLHRVLEREGLMELRSRDSSDIRYPENLLSIRANPKKITHFH